ncbi:hypothetical protein [Rubrivivax gelatinosus]|uniref:hypothetical protein n=1 Tax=Rubrivivax gelatinosus TaxID=28068 RepID=UPI0009D97E74|nr:hypothetical protein [Rubrivivax gelatinosus]MBG6082980.1 hypothetical protein [Rubrivivax gelatinosus]
MQLDFFAVLDEPLGPVVQEGRQLGPLAHPERPPAPAHPPGSYVIRSEGAGGYWNNELGWVYDVARATPYGPEHVCPAVVVQWRRDGHPIMSARGHWFWIAQRGGLSGYKGADYDGPFDTEALARAQAIAALGPDRPLMAQRDSEYVLAEVEHDFSLD